MTCQPSQRVFASRPSRSVLRPVLLLAALTICNLPAAADQIELASDAPQALSPEASREQFQLPDGFRIDALAAEPLLADPVAMAFDASGGVFVCEIHGYNLEGYLDVLELNRSGQLDTAVRRVPASDDAQRQAAAEQYGTVKRLEDTDGDGRCDRVTVWADRLPPCYGVVPAGDGVIVLCAPDIVYLADRDGDGQPELRETLYTGFGANDMWSRINNPRWGLDNWIYAVNGIGSGGRITGPHLDQPVTIGATCFRFQADGSAIEPVSGSTSGFGQTMNDWGDRFLVTNQQHVLLVAPLPYRYLIRNPYYASPNPLRNICSYGHPAQVFPTSQPDPWRLARSRDPAWVRFYGVAEATANGFFTAASGQLLYRADQFPAAYRDHHFSVDNAQNLVHRCRLLPDGVLWKAERPGEDAEREFLTSTEAWFRPVNLALGPDGGLYIVDMYRAIIEDYSAIPRYLQQQYIQSLIDGADRGRIWRVVHETPARQPAANLAAASTEALVAALGHENAWWRETAQRLLVERGDRSAIALLEQTVRSANRPQARLHALYTLSGLAALQPELVAAAVRDAHFAVRMHALQLAEPWLDDRGGLLEQVLTLEDDESPRVRLQLALTLGECRDPRAAETLRQLAVRDGRDGWLQAAILSSAASTAAGLVAGILEQGERAGQSDALLAPLAAVVAARRDQTEIAAVLQAVVRADAARPPDDEAAFEPVVLRGLLEGFQGGRPPSLATEAGRAALRGLLGSPHKEISSLAFQLAGKLHFREAPEMAAIIRQALATARDPTRPAAERIAALSLLDGATREELRPLTELLNPWQPLEVQLAAIRQLSSLDDAAVADWLLAEWPSRTPQVQAAALEAIVSHRHRLPRLLDALARGAVPVSSLDARHRARLLDDADAGVQRRAREVFQGQGRPAERLDVLDRYRPALHAQRNAEHGKVVFDKQCGKCHQVQGRGYAVGPDLTATTRRSDEMLLADILDPSNQITAGFHQYNVVTQDGRILSGVLAAETATSVTLRREEAAETTILRKDIEELAASPISMMPERLEQEVAPQDVADLIAYLREAFGPVPPPLLILFDDDPEFAQLLNEGDGTAVVQDADVYSGQSALAIAPPQRFSASIPGWEYPIRGDPAPGEYRYLRFAWKADAARGVMLELADQGNWPAAGEPRLRYFSGRNETGWQAVQVEAQTPRHWTVVTRDLWKEFGAFTLTGLAPTAIGGRVLFDRIELLRTLEDG